MQEVPDMASNTEKSLPTRGGWIEIRTVRNGFGSAVSPSPHGEGGLKYYKAGAPTVSDHVPPHTGRVD